MIDKRLLARLIQEEIWSQTAWPDDETCVSVWWDAISTQIERDELHAALRAMLTHGEDER